MFFHSVKKFSLSLIFSLLTSAAYAMGPGMYFGLQAGETNLHNKTEDVQTGTTPAVVSTSPTNTGMGGRLFGGYQFNQYGAAEVGFTYYSPSKYEPSGVTMCSTPEIREYSGDIVGKGMLPLGAVNLYGKGGLAIAYTKQSNSLGSTTSSDGCDVGTDSSNLYFKPTATIGVSYDLSQSWVADLSYMRIFAGGGFQAADLISLGIAYHFTDKYCGQFLC